MRPLCFSTDPKPFPPPMKICSEMLEVMGGIGGEGYTLFVAQCCQAYKILRFHAQLLCVLLDLMVDSGIKDIKKNLVSSTAYPAELAAHVAPHPASGSAPPQPGPAVSAGVSVAGPLGSNLGSGAPAGLPKGPVRGAEAGVSVAGPGLFCGDRSPQLSGSGAFFSDSGLLSFPAATASFESEPSPGGGSAPTHDDLEPRGAGAAAPQGAGSAQEAAPGRSRRRVVCVALEKVKEKLRLDLGDEDAERFLVGVINSSARALFPAVVDKLHEWALYWR
ncbi:putative phosphatidylinositol 3-kinase [Toxoplasma gondii GAB2-2007-GAL-DOM2]|uniref:Putative phosphatidylinositol 3-kinase n=1 Tax=Toxoplasma gondii GAB2-2007-GAL-DOM2 TaxID=1130820 RepID=A0A086JVI9_TOXGO|nr:putative phosphatidylinositol 3-kinase [Toxoplasma gondii GAB2-2007-GAL-DOM2]